MPVSRIQAAQPQAISINPGPAPQKDGAAASDPLFAMLLAAASGPVMPPTSVSDALSAPATAAEDELVTALAPQPVTAGLIAALLAQIPPTLPTPPNVPAPPVNAIGSQAPNQPTVGVPVAPPLYQVPKITVPIEGIVPPSPAAKPAAEVHLPPPVLPASVGQARMLLTDRPATPVPAPALPIIPAALAPTLAPVAEASPAQGPASVTVEAGAFAIAMGAAESAVMAAPAPEPEQREAGEEPNESETALSAAIVPQAPDKAGLAGPIERPTAPPAAEGRVSVDHVMDRVTHAVRSMKDGSYTVTLHLQPEHLGEVRLQLHVAGTAVETLITVANPEARQSLADRGDQLREQLNQAGLSLSGFSVSTGQEGRQQSARQQMEDLLSARRQARSVGGLGTPTFAPAAPRRVAGGGSRSGILDTMA